MTQLELFPVIPVIGNYKTYSLDWRGHRINVRYDPDWCKSYRRIMGYPLAHLEINAPGKIPGTILSATGYMSHFNRPDNIGDDPVEAVRDWLERTAK